MRFKTGALLVVGLSLGSAAQAAGPVAPHRMAQPANWSTHDVGTNQLGPSARATFDYAVRSFHERRYAGAYGRFASLADAGHIPSAKIALVMFQNGRTLFNSDWSASTEQQQYWATLVMRRTLKGVEIIDDGRGD